MPRITTKRTDILRKEEITETLDKAQNIQPWLSAVIALLWVFGKRINEIMRLKADDLWTDEKYLYCRFFVGKKKTRTAPIIPERYLKRINLNHPSVKYIQEWQNITQKGYLFPAKTLPSSIKVNRTWIVNGKEHKNTYNYQNSGGYIQPNLVRYYLKKANKKIWPHLFRHSLATEFSERGKTVQQLMDWFDWSSPRQAVEYVQRGPGLTKELSDRDY
jgi:integrase